MRAPTRLALALAPLVVACGAPDGHGHGGDDPDHQPIAGACPTPAADVASDPSLDCIDALAPAEPATFGQDQLPAVLLGPPQGGGSQGGVDVLSLGCGGEITVAFDPPAIVDGPGADLIIFENAFAFGDHTFAEPARVLVSDDGIDWREFPCEHEDLAPAPPSGCAGVGLVFASDASGVDPRDPAAAGGDAFDLADVGLERARYVRLIDVTEAYYGDRMWCGGASAGFDLDAMIAVH